MVSAKITTSDGMQTISLDKDKTISLSPGEHLELAPDVIPLSLLKVGDQLIIVLENNIVIKVNNYFSFNNSAEESPLLTVLGETFVPADFETTLGLVSTVGVVNFELPALYADQHSESDLSLNTAKDLNPLSLAHRELSELYIEKLTNSPPDAVDDNYTVNEDGLLIETILANDSDPDGDAFGIIGFSQVTIPLSLDSLGNLILDLSIIPEYQSLAEGEIGVTHFEYTIADTHGLTDSAIVTVSVIGVNDEPIANADEAITDEDSGIVIDVLANDTDVDVGDSLSVVAIDSSDTVGTVSITNGGDDVSYNPTGFDYLAVGETAIDTFEYTIMDSEGATSSSTVSVTITGVNDAPVANADNDITDEDTLLMGNVLSNDSDVDVNDILTVIDSDGLSVNGATVVVDSNGNYSYDPSSASVLQSLAVGENLVDSFTYTISDGNGGTSSATVTVTVNGVNDGPIANDDTNSTDEDTAINGNVLSNDSDVDATDVLTVIASDNTSANGATVVVDSNGNYSYDPSSASVLQSLAVGENLVDSFTYTISDGNGGTSSATVTVTVNGLNDGPIANDDTNSTDEDTAINGNVLSNDSDVDAVGALTVIASDNTSVNGATVVVDSNGNYSYDPSSASVLQSLAVGENLVDSFTYTISDDNGGTSSATVTVTVNGLNDGPIANDDTNSTDEDTAINGNVLSNDSDVDATDVLTVIASDNTSANGATVVVDSNGNYSYDPSNASVLQSLVAGESLVDSFTYTISDGNGGTSSATVSVTVNGVNDGPIANDDTDSTDEDTAINGNVLSNDSDVDAVGTLTVIASDNTSVNGATVVVDSNGNYSYDPSSASVLQSLAVGENLVDSFTYTISDDNGGMSSATVTVTVNGLNDAPTAIADTASTDEDNSVTGNVLSNDVEIDNGDTIDVLAFDATSGLGATITMDSAGNYIYDPTSSTTLQDLNDNETLTDTFTYTITDDNGATSSTTVTVTVNGSNDAVILLNEIGLDAVTSPVSNTANIDFIEIYNGESSSMTANGYILELSGADVGSFTFNPASTVTIPSNGFLVLYGDGDYQVFDSNGDPTGISGNEINNTFDFLDSNGDGFVDTRDEVGVNLRAASGILDTFVANGANFGTQEWTVGPNVSATALSLLPNLLDLSTFNGQAGDQQSILDTLNITRPDADGDSVAAKASNRIFDRVFTTDGNNSSDWTTTDTFSHGLNNESSNNPQDEGNDDFNPEQNNTDPLAGQTVSITGSGDDQLEGNAGSDILLSGEGNDTLSGGAHNDILFGDSGNDELYGETGADILVDVDGSDLLVGGTGSDILISHAPTLGGTTVNGDAGDILIGDSVQQEAVPTEFDIVYLIDVSGSMGQVNVVANSGTTAFLDGNPGGLFQVRGFPGPTSLYNNNVLLDNVSNSNEWSVSLTRAQLDDLIFQMGSSNWAGGNVPADFDIDVRYANSSDILTGAYTADTSTAPIVAVREAFQALNQSIIDEGFGDVATVKVFGFNNNVSAVSTAESPYSTVLNDFINSLTPGGSTNFETPLQSAADYLANQSTDSNKIIYFFSDGEDSSGYSPSAALEAQLASLEVDLRVFGLAIDDGATNLNEPELEEVAQTAGDSTNEATIVFPDTAGGLTAALASSSLSDAATGSDVIIGGDGDDLIFGDNIYLDFELLSNETGVSVAALEAEFAADERNFLFNRVVGSSLELLHESIGVEDYIQGNGGADVIWAGGGDDEVLGNDGNDTIIAGNGADYVSGGADDDVIFGGKGADNLEGDEGNDLLYGGEGNDRLVGGTGDDQLEGGAGDDTLLGGTGFDTVSYENSTNPNGVNVSLDLGTATGDGTDTLDSIEGVIGSTGNDTLLGNNDNNILMGGAGDDKLDGADGNDMLLGGDGNDTLLGGSGDDIFMGTANSFYSDISIDGGLDFDTLSFTDNGNIDFSNFSSNILSNFEAIDLNGDNQSLTLEPIDVINMSTNSTLFIGTDNSNTSISSSTAWNSGGTSTVNGVMYDVFTSGGATLYVEQDVNSTDLI